MKGTEMASGTRGAPRLDFADILGRACLVGVATGAVIGGLVGTTLFPFVLTALGGAAGAAIGAVLGLVNGLALGIGVRRSLSRSSMVAIGASTSFAGTALFAVASTDLPLWARLACPPIAAIAGIVLGPIAAFGTSSLDSHSRAGQRPLAELLARIAGSGLVAGAAIGAITGLIIGLHSYPATAPVALVEGAAFGSACAAVCAGLVAFAVIWRRQWPSQ
jgi:hypothetical protein